jgi:hypothetical protein
MCARILVPVNPDSHTSIGLTSLVIACLILLGVGAAVFCSRCKRMLESRRTSLAPSSAEPLANESIPPTIVYSKAQEPKVAQYCTDREMV